MRGPEGPRPAEKKQQQNAPNGDIPRQIARPGAVATPSGHCLTMNYLNLKSIWIAGLVLRLAGTAQAAPALELTQRAQ